MNNPKFIVSYQVEEPIIIQKVKRVKQIYIQSNLDYSKCQGPQESFRIIGSSNDRKQEFSDLFGKAWMLP